MRERGDVVPAKVEKTKIDDGRERITSLKRGIDEWKGEIIEFVEI